MPESLWNRIAGLPLAVESHVVEHLHAPADRTTLLVRLRGRGAEGLGEDVGGTMIDEDGRFVAVACELGADLQRSLAARAGGSADHGVVNDGGAAAGP